MKFVETYRQKNIAIAAGFVLILVLFYFLTISKVIKLGHSIDQLKQQEKLAVNAPANIIEYQRQLEKLDNQIAAYLVDTSDGEQHLLELISTFCQNNKLILTAFPKPDIQEKENIKVYTRTVSIQGDFISLLKLLYHLEYEKKVGRMASVQFKSYLQKRTKRKKLNLILQIQNCLVTDKPVSYTHLTLPTTSRV